MWTCNKRLWKTVDGKIVEDGDSRARTLFAVPGTVLKEKPMIEKAMAPAEDKAIDPVEDKAIHPVEDKAKRSKK